MTHAELMNEHEAVNQKLTHVTNLVAALQIVAWDVAQLQGKEPISNDRRDAIVGLSDALGKVLAEPESEVAA